MGSANFRSPETAVRNQAFHFTERDGGEILANEWRRFFGRESLANESTIRAMLFR